MAIYKCSRMGATLSHNTDYFLSCYLLSFPACEILNVGQQLAVCVDGIRKGKTAGIMQ